MEAKEMTVEVAFNNLGALLSSNELKLCKGDHIALEKSLFFLHEKAKEAETLLKKD